MATEATQAPVNGNYNHHQYGGPDSYNGSLQSGQLSASAATPQASSTHATAPSASSGQTSTEPSADISKDEVGWYFVEQYYNTMSKNPEKLHLFYSKRSQFVSGIEAEKVLVSVGQKAISDRIKSLDFQDCKVRVLNVDSQSSFQNIIVQVIGEMSNKSAPHRKFVQTFVLAEQPNGYFVLNDMFRYLVDEEEELEGEEPEQPAVEAVTQRPEEKADASEDAAVAAVQSSDSLKDQGATEAVDAKLEEAAKQEISEPEVPVEQATTNGPIENAVEAPAPTVQDAVSTTDATEDTKEIKLQAEKPKEPEPTPVASPPKATTPTPAQEAAPAPAPAPKAAPKTWASLVAANKAPTPAVPTVAPATSPAPQAKSATPAAQPQTPPPGTADSAQGQAAAGNGWQTAGDHGKRQSRPPAPSGESQGIVLAYIKNVSERVDASLLKQALTKFGKLAYFDVSRQKNCAFVEFETPAGYAAAVQANPHQIGTEVINVEERRPRPNAFGGSGSYGTRGGSLGRGGRGGSDGRTPSQGRGGFQNKDAGRGGGFAQRGGRGSGNVTPKGRGTAQAA